MYQSRAVHALALAGPPQSEAVSPMLLRLWTAIGEHWQFIDSADEQLTRLRSFMDNRINLNPLYKAYYDFAEQVIADLISQHGDPDAFNVLFSTVEGTGVPQSPLDATKRLVVDEFIALRVALGGFLAFGAVNYCGYFGGANIKGEPIPYRAMGEA